MNKQNNENIEKTNINTDATEATATTENTTDATAAAEKKAQRIAKAKAAGMNIWGGLNKYAEALAINTVGGLTAAGAVKFLKVRPGVGGAIGVAAEISYATFLHVCDKKAQKQQEAAVKAMADMTSALENGFQNMEANGVQPEGGLA